MSERRRDERTSCTELVNISTETRKDRAGLARDVSASGLCFQSASRFEIGERVGIYIESRSLGRLSMVGRVVWTSIARHHHPAFPFRAAVELDAPRAELAAGQERASRDS